jgi:predicted peptidase
MKIETLAAAMVFSVLARAGQPAEPGQHTQTFEKQMTVKLDYLLFLPEGYARDEGKKWPTILFLHGAGERGSDLNKVKIHGPPKIVEGKKDFPFIVVSPQCPEDSWWEPLHVLALLDEVQAKYRVDPERVYLTGLSMGGFGTWEIAMRAPQRFAAIAPICGGGNPVRLRWMKNVPAWVFHGDKDSVVPVQMSDVMVDALKKAGAEVRYTRYEGVDHDSWTKTYENQELYDWFLAHKRAPKSEKK